MNVKRRRRSTRETPSVLREFARAYLHEDFIRDYGSALGAARAFAADASEPERQQLALALRRLAETSADWNAARLSAFVTVTLGAAWTSPSTAQLRQMAAAIDVAP